MAEDPGVFVQELHIAARPEIVYRYFTEPARMACWMGLDHRLEPVPGGEFRVDVTGRDLAVGRYVELVPPSRVVFTFGWERDAEMPPGSTTVEVDLRPDGDGTHLRFSHRGLPPARGALHADGWHHYLGRLQEAAGGGTPERDPWIDTGPTPA